MSVLTPLLYNFGLLSLAALGLMVVTRRWGLPGNRKTAHILIGLGFGAISALVITHPVTGPLGASFDTRAAPIVLAGCMGGPMGGIIAAAISALARLYVGGPAVVGGVVSAFIYAVVGIAYAYRSTSIGKPPIQHSSNMLVLGFVATVAVLPAFFIGQSWTMGLVVLSKFWWVLLASNVGGIYLLCLLCREVLIFTEEHRNLAAIRRQHDLARNAAGVGIWHYDYANDHLIWDQVQHGIMGTRPGTFAENFAAFAEVVHEADRDRVAASFDAARRSHRRFKDHFRIRKPDGAVRHVSAEADFFDLVDELPMTAIGVNMDITELVHARNAAEDARKFLSQAIESMEQGFVIYDVEDRLQVCNSRYRDLYKTSADLLVPGVKFEDLLRESVRRGQFPEAIGHEEDWIAKRMEAHRLGTQFADHQLDDGTWLHVGEHKTPSEGIVGYRIDVTELVKARKAAEAASEAKSTFLATMSHELRTPLNAIIGFGQFLQSGLVSDKPDKQREFAGHICAAGSELLNLVNDILDLSRLEIGRLEFTIQDTEAVALVKSSVNLVRQAHVASDITVLEDFEAVSECQVRTDPSRLGQILGNIVSNAIKYNRPGGSVTVSTHLMDADYLRISVKDTGIGISKQAQSRIFNLFERDDQAVKQAISGSGIGLSVSKRLAERIGVVLSFDSEVGVGTEFHIDVPIAGNTTVLLPDEHSRTGIDPIDRDHLILAHVINKLSRMSSRDADAPAEVRTALELMLAHHAREEAVISVIDPGNPRMHQESHGEFSHLLRRQANAFLDHDGGDHFDAYRDTIRLEWIECVERFGQHYVDTVKGRQHEIAQAIQSLGPDPFEAWISANWQ